MSLASVAVGPSHGICYKPIISGFHALMVGGLKGSSILAKTDISSRTLYPSLSPSSLMMIERFCIVAVKVLGSDLDEMVAVLLLLLLLLPMSTSWLLKSEKKDVQD
jgi:hypothetical protein